MASEVILHNLMEKLVDSKLDELMQEADVCCCERCRTDALALSLNNLPPKYIVSVGGDIYARYEAMKAQCQADITATILNAIAVVDKYPRHKLKHGDQLLHHR